MARDFFDPTDRVAVLEKVLPYFDTTDSQAAVGAIRVVVLLCPTAPAPESFLDCQPSHLLPTYWYLFAKLFRTQAATSALVEHFSLLAEKHLGCRHVPFGAHGVFHEMQSREIFGAISRLTLVDDKNTDDTFDDPSLHSSYQDVAAKYAAVWIVFSLSPSCLGQKSSVLSGLEGLIASIGILYHPNSTIQSRLSFVTKLLRQLAHQFCWRYNKEQDGQLATPPERRINNELRQKFVSLLRDPVLLGCFSKNSNVRLNCFLAAKPLANLEPGLIVPTALQRFYASQDSQVDGDSAGFSMWLLAMLCSTVTQEKGLRCHLPTLMNLALSGINASRPNLTMASCRFILWAICDLPPHHLRLNESGESEHPAEAEAWIVREIESLNDGGSVVDIDYHKKLSDNQEVALLRSAFSSAESFILRFLERVFHFASEAFRNHFDADKNPERDMAQRDILAAAEACFMSLSPQMLEEVIVFLSQRLSSDPIPKARDIVKSLVDYAVRANPGKGLKILVPMLVKHIRKEIEERWSETRLDRHDLLSADENLCWYASALRSCLWRGGSELLPYKDDVLKLAQFAEEKCGSRAFGLCGMISVFMLSGWTETYTNRCAVFGTGQPGRDGQDKAAMKVVTWHAPSPEEIQTACEVFESETTRFEEEIRALIDRHHSLSGAGASVAWARSLTGALGCLNNMVCGMATLFDPSHAQAGGNGDTAFYDRASDDAACVSLRVQDFHCVLEPCDPLYTKIHKRRGAIGVLARKVHAFLLGHEGQYSDCLSGVYKLYRTLVSDVGICNAHQDMGRFRKKQELWEAGSRTDGVALLHTSALRVTLMDRYHAELQAFGTGYRHMGDLERNILQDVIEGCCSPFVAVHNAAQNLLLHSTQQLAGSAEFFLPLLLAKVRNLIRSNNHHEIENALKTLVWGNSWWTRHCPSQIPDLLQILMETAAFDVPKVPGISTEAKKGIGKLGIPDYRGRIIFPKDGIVEAIRPAGNYSNAAHKVRKVQYESNAKLRKEKEALGIQMLESTAEPNLCALSIRALIRVGFDKDAPPSVKHVSFLANNTIAGDLELRKKCADQLRRLIRDFLVGIRFRHNYEDFLRTQETGGREQVLVVPGRDADYTEQYLARFENLADDNNGGGGHEDDDDIFVDPSFHGSLMWPVQFHAQRRHVEPPNYDPETASMAGRIGLFLTKEWFEKFLSNLQLEEQPLEGDKVAAEPGIRSHNIELLTHAFQLMEMGATAAKLEDMEDLVGKILGDGTNIGQHLATATLLLGLLLSPTSRAFRNRVLKTVDPLLIDIIEHKMIRSSETWAAFLHCLVRNHDPRRFPGLIRLISSLRLSASDPGTQSHAKLQMLSNLLVGLAWRFRHAKDVAFMLLQTKDTISSVEISDALGTTLAQVYTARFHDSWPDVRALIATNQNASSLGIRAYKLHSDMRETVTQLFAKVSALRKKTPVPHQDYHCASTATLAFVLGILNTNAAESLIPLLIPILKELFPMLDAQLTEKTKLKELATSALEKLCRLPFREDEHGALWEAVLEKAKSGPFFHCTAAMSMIRVLYLRRLLISEPDEQMTVLKAVCDKIQDTDMKIQIDATETLTHLLSRSRLSMVEPFIIDLVNSSEHTLRKPRKVNNVRLAKPDMVRLAAVRRLGATVSAYPQLMVSPDWMVKAMESITKEILAGTGSSIKIAVEAARGFKEARRTQWDMVKKVSLLLPPRVQAGSRPLIFHSIYRINSSRTCKTWLGQPITPSR